MPSIQEFVRQPRTFSEFRKQSLLPFDLSQLDSCSISRTRRVSVQLILDRVRNFDSVMKAYLYALSRDKESDPRKGARVNIFNGQRTSG